MIKDYSPFCPRYGSGKLIDVTTTSSATAIDPQDSNQAVITNTGENEVYFRFGYDNSVAAIDEEDMLITPGSSIVISLSKDPVKTYTHIATQSNVSDSVIHIIFGTGL